MVSYSIILSKSNSIIRPIVECRYYVYIRTPTPVDGRGQTRTGQADQQRILGERETLCFRGWRNCLHRPGREIFVELVGTYTYIITGRVPYHHGFTIPPFSSWHRNFAI